MLLDATGRDGRERGDRHRHPLAEMGLRRLPFCCAQMRVGERAGVGVPLQQPVEQPRQVGHEHIGARQAAEVGQ